MATITELRELFEIFLTSPTQACQLSLEAAIAQYAANPPSTLEPRRELETPRTVANITVQAQSIPQLQKIVEQITCHNLQTLLTVEFNGTVVVNVNELNNADTRAVVAGESNPPRELWEFINKRASFDWTGLDQIHIYLSEHVLE